jgi:hypothetical protein
MLRARLLTTTLALAVACAPDSDPAPEEYGEAHGRAERGAGDRASDAARVPGGDDASSRDASSRDASSGDGGSPDASSSEDSGPGGAGEDASVPDDAGEASEPDASEPDDPDPPDAARPHDGLCTRCGDCEEVQTLPGAAHIEGDLVYPDPPPTGGDHNPCWTTYGVHTEPVPDERWVHNLEHGAVVFLYNCPGGCPSEIAQLRALVEACGVFAVLTPYELLPKRFGVVSWGHRLVSDCLDIDALRAFYDANVDNGGESNPANPPSYCTP